MSISIDQGLARFMPRNRPPDPASAVKSFGRSVSGALVVKQNLEVVAVQFELPLRFSPRLGPFLRVASSSRLLARIDLGRPLDDGFAHLYVYFSPLTGRETF